MFDKDSDRSCPSVWQISSSKEVCAKRVGGWVLLSVLVLAIVYGSVTILNSRSQKHYEQVYVIDSAIEAWDENYKSDVETWYPSIINYSGEEYPLAQSNRADFKSDYSDLKNYTVVKYHMEDIKDLLENQTTKVVGNPVNGEFNITSSLLAKFSDGQSVTLPDIPLYIKKKSPRSQKDCTLNHIGIWNTTDNTCYVFNQLLHLCYIVSQENYPNLAENYTEFPWDELNKYYASYAFYRWTDPDTNPTPAQFHSAMNITLTMRSDKDPYVVGYTKVDIVSDKEDNTMLLYGLIIGILALIAIFVPFKLICTEDEYVPTSSREKVQFMHRV